VQANFIREKNAGMLSEAYFIGRSLWHLVISTFAVAYFMVPFYWLTSPHASFWPLYGVFFLVYQCCAGVGQFWSVVVDTSLASLISILTILSFVLFGGSLYEDQLNFPDNILQIILYVPSYISPIRWAYELFFLVMIDPFRPYLSDPDVTYAHVQYGFTFDHYDTGK
jgi:hypothetical protein